VPAMDETSAAICEGKAFLHNVKPMAEGELLNER